jgi:hypothetical protein
MRLGEIPYKLYEWLGADGYEDFTIFISGGDGLHIVMNGDLPHQLWKEYRKGNLKAFLDSINYEEKEVVREEGLPEDVLCRILTIAIIQDLSEDPSGKSSTHKLLADPWE